MSRHRSGFVLGYHGCDEAIAEAVFSGEEMLPSDKDYDWLGFGIYFWEGDADRAREWAVERVAPGKISSPAVIGAVIELGNCLDLTIREHLDMLSDAHGSLKIAFEKAGKPLPENKGMSSGHTAQKPLRYLDCAVINHLNSNIEEEAEESRRRGEVPAIEPFDTVRGMFLEGTALYPGAGFDSHTHSQIAVRSPASIRGYFRPR